MQTFSFSRLNKFISCPAAFYAAYVAEVEEASSYPLVLGKAVHNVIEAAMRLGRSDEEFFSVLSKTVADTAPLYIDPEEVMGLSCQDAVLGEFSPENRVEEHVREPLDDDIFIQGYLDLYRESSGGIELVDWKTNWKEYGPADNYQLALYAWCLFKKFNRPVRGKLVFLRWGKFAEHEYTEKEMEEARDWALNTAHDIQRRLHRLEKEPGQFPAIFPATPGDTCQYCGYAPGCIEYPLPDPDDVDTYEKMKELAAQILRLDSALGEMKNKLKEYVEVCGPVKLNKKMYTSGSGSYWTFDARAKKKALGRIMSEGKDPFEFFNLTGYQLKKLGWDDQYIASLGAKLKEKKPQLRLVTRDD